ncbi:phage neck terminator protein [Paraburkholderia sp. MM6662-R1]|uniref:phage neck terminator protein n=1 Tax=Paraburkholderia sp. MM6662-R1 TaxID=2991066 RepID=UPI003D1E0051
MRAELSFTESEALAALRAFLLGILADGIEVVQGQDNRVSEPQSPDFVVMWPLLRDRLATNVTRYSDGFPAAPSVKQVSQSTRLTVQLDVHGPASADNAQIITTLFRDSYGVDALAASGIEIAPLYTSEARQVPFRNAENEVERRWTIDLQLQIKPVVTVAQEFADSLEIGTAGNPVTAETTVRQAWNGLINVDRLAHK